MKEREITTEQRLLFNEQVTIRMPNVLLNRVDSLAQNAIQTRGAWLRTAVLDKVRDEERIMSQRTRESQ